MLRKLWLTSALCVAAFAGATGSAWSDTLAEAMAKAYSYNQNLNATRAGLRATDESVPQARAGMRPFISASGGISATRSRAWLSDGRPNQSGRQESISAGIQINQIIFDGFQTPNNVSAAQAQVRASQANLANTVQNTLLEAVEAFVNVRRDRQIAQFRRDNLAFLREQVRAADARFEVGEGTRTDVAQAQAQEALATALLNSALAQVAVSEANYLGVIGDAPGQLGAAPQPPQRLMPSSIGQALQISQGEHPAIAATQFAVEAASFQVKSAEGSLLPEISVGASVDNTYSLTEPGPSTGLPGVNINVATQNQLSATVGAQLTIPIYQGGLASSQIREAKEVLGQRRIEVDGTRDQVRTFVASSWAQLQAARANVTGYRAQLEAGRLALSGVTEERSVGQRTTLDVLNAQEDVLAAQILLAGAERDVIFSAYSLISAIGRMEAMQLALNTEIYDPEEHYQQVHDKWHGTRTPDGR